MTERLVVIGASAGGVDALAQIARDLPEEIDAAIVAVLHIGARNVSSLAQIVDRAGPLPAVQAESGALIRRGTIYVAPPDCHVLVRGEALEVVRGPKENGHRPAIDPLFRSAAATWGARTVGVVLTGLLDDGSAGAVAIARRGGLVVVQDPDDALFDDMPRNAIGDDSPEAIVPIAEMGATIARIVAQPVAGLPATQQEPAQDELEVEYAALDEAAVARPAPPGDISPYGCPECGGVLTEADDDAVIRFRCRVGHAYTAEVLLEFQERTIEEALFTAVRALEERADLSRRFARRMRRNDLDVQARRAEENAATDERQADVLRRVLTRQSEVAGSRDLGDNG